MSHLRLTTILATAALSLGSAALPARAQQAGPTPVQAATGSVAYKCDHPDASEVTGISLAALPIVSNGALFAAFDAGVFKKHGLDVQFRMVNALPALVSAVQGGAVDFAFSGTLSTFQAIDKGIKLTVVAPFAGIAPGYWDKMQAGVPGYTREITALLVAPNSPIKSPGDLNGKTVAVSDVKGQADLTTRYVIQAHGGNPSSVRFVVMSYADAVNALMAGQIDAAYSTEPAIIRAEQAGYKIISWPGVEALHEGPTSVIIAATSYVLKNPEVVVWLNCAIREATVLGQTDPDLIRRTTAKWQHVDPASLDNAVVPYFFQSVDMDGLRRYWTLQKDAGFLSTSFPIESVVIPQALNKPD